MTVKNYLYAETIQQALDSISDEELYSQLISGGAGVADQIRNGYLDCDQLVDISRIPEMKDAEVISQNGESYLKLGSALTLNQAARFKQMEMLFPLLYDALTQSTDPARRNAFTLGGVLATKIPAGMLFPALCALDSKLVIARKDSTSSVLIEEWMKAALNEEAFIITAVLVPIRQVPVWRVKDVKRRMHPGEIVAGVLVLAEALRDGGSDNIRVYATLDQYGLVTFEGIPSLQKKSLTKEKIDDYTTSVEAQLMRWGTDGDAVYRRKVVKTLVQRCLAELFLPVLKETL